MRKLLLALFLISFLAPFLHAGIEYQFQEGFTLTTPTGWIRQCNTTSSVNHTGLSFSGANAAKFDATGSGRYNKNLITPAVTGADSLSFYVSKNANATYMTLYVGKIIGTDTTIIGTYNAFNFPYKTATPGFSKITVPVNDGTANMKFIFYATISTDPLLVNAGWFVVDDIELTKFTGTVLPPDPITSVDKILTDFGDGTWGPVATTAYATGAYPSSTINGYNLVKTYLLSGSLTCTAGGTHTNRILLGKNSEGAVLEFPTLTTVGEVDIHAATGTAGNSFQLQEYVGNQWQVLGTYATIKSPDSIYTIPLLRNTPTKLRIANNTGSGLYVYKIATRTWQEMTDVTLTGSSPTQGEICYSNLKKTITLTFNRNVQIAGGTMLLNGVSIPLSGCTIAGNVVTIPVALPASSSSDTNCVFTVSAGTFAETGNATNLSKDITLNFQTVNTVAYPTNYSGQLDVVYKNVNSTNCRMDIYYPTNAASPVPVIINMHGGGWNHGMKEDQGGFSMYFSMGYAVANVEYRMTGEALAPAAVEDVRGAMIYLLNHASQLNIDKNKIVFQGGSAGGHLALIGGYLRNNHLYDNDCVPYSGDFKIMAVIDKYGPADLPNFMFYGSLVDWLGPHATDAAYILTLSPLNYVDANTPPTYIIHGDADPTVPYSQSVTLQAALQAAGVTNQFTTVPGGGHGGFTDAYNTQMENEITAFLTRINNQTSTSVDPLTAGRTIQMRQNGNTFEVNSAGKTSIRVFDPMGNEILRTQNKDFRINLKGMYVIKAENPQESIVLKVIVQ